MLFSKEIQRNYAIVRVINPKDTETAKIPSTMFQEKGFIFFRKNEFFFFSLKGRKKMRILIEDLKSI